MTQAGPPNPLQAFIDYTTQALNKLAFEQSRIRQSVAGLEATEMLRRARRPMPDRPVRFRAQFGEDLLAWDLLGRPLEGFFIEVGAFDGDTLSVSAALEQMGWRGLLIEANPDACAKCRANRPLARVVHAALAQPGAGEAIELQVSGDGAAGVFSYTQSSPSHLALIAKHGLTTRSVRVPLTTMDALLAEHRGPIDLAVIDVEGAEVPLLRGFDLHRFAPRLLIIEDNQGGQDPALTAHMQAFPYTHVGSFYVNRVYVRNDQREIFDRFAAMSR
jgi:FkbM family methyltransferase